MAGVAGRNATGGGWRKQALMDGVKGRELEPPGGAPPRRAGGRTTPGGRKHGRLALSHHQLIQPANEPPLHSVCPDAQNMTRCDPQPDFQDSIDHPTIAP